MSRALARVGLGVSALSACGYLLLLGWVWQVSRQDQRRATDAIVILGAAQYNGRPSPVLRARLDHAIRLYHAGLAPLVIVTGGTGRGDQVSEALVGHRYLVANTVPDSVVVDRPEGRTTEASMVSVAEWARRRALRSVLLVSDAFHMGRLRLESRRMRLRVYTSPTPTSPILPGSRLEWTYLAMEALKLPVAWVRMVLAEE